MKYVGVLLYTLANANVLFAYAMENCTMGSIDSIVGGSVVFLFVSLIAIGLLLVSHLKGRRLHFWFYLPGLAIAFVILAKGVALTLAGNDAIYCEGTWTVGEVVSTNPMVSWFSWVVIAMGLLGVLVPVVFVQRKSS